MPAGKSNTTARRGNVRRTVRKPQSGLRSMLSHRFVWWAVLYALVTTVVGGWLIHTADQRPQYVVGDIATQPIVPRVAFDAIDERVGQTTTQLQQEQPHLQVFGL